MVADVFIVAGCHKSNTVFTQSNREYVDLIYNPKMLLNNAAISNATQIRSKELKSNSQPRPTSSLNPQNNSIPTFKIQDKLTDYAFVN